MKTNQILGILTVVSWVLFLGLCISTGSILISFIVSLFNPEGAYNLYMGMNLSKLYEFSKWHYIAMASLVIILSALKAYLFFWVVKIISKINVTHPFSKDIANIISKMSGIALQIGIMAVITNIYAQSLMKKNIYFTYQGGGAEFLYLAGILFVIAIIFKKGIEIQNENELTI